MHPDAVPHRRSLWPATLALLLATSAVQPLLAQDDADEQPNTWLVSAELAGARPAGPALLLLTADPALDPLVAAGAAVMPDGTLAQLDRHGDDLALRWVAEQPLEAGRIEVVLQGLPVGATPGGYQFRSMPGRRELWRGDRRIYSFEHAFEPLRAPEATYKPFHQVGSLHDDGFVTKGVGGHFTHHRGLFVGWNKTSTPSGGRHDFWHCRGGASQRWRETLSQTAGPVCADSVEQIDWCHPDGSAMVHEVRSLTAWNVAADRHVLDVAIELWAAGDEAVQLRGDPQHAGFQFRAAEAVHEAQDRTNYVRPETASGGNNDVWTGLGWAMLQFGLRGQDYDVVHISHPDNPGGWVYSTRAYGRFGSFQEFDLQPGEPAVLRYRVVVARRSAGIDPAAEAAAFTALTLSTAD